MLVFGDARARVWTTQDERYVFVTAAGAERDRDDLVTMIRGTLAELFRSYRGLEVTEQWEHEGQWVPRKTLENFGRLEREDEPDLGLEGVDAEETKGVEP